MYYFYVGSVLLPIAPQKLSVKIGGQNKTYNLINDGEINVLKSPKLTEIEFDVILPNYQYSFATYNGGFRDANSFIQQFETMKMNKSPFQFIVTRVLPNGRQTWNTNITVSLENYNVVEDAKNAFDVTLSIKLKQYKPYGTKIMKLKVIDDTATATTDTVRDSSTAPNKDLPKTITVKPGDCLWNLCKQYTGNGTGYAAVAKANGISNPNLIYPGQQITIS